MEIVLYALLLLAGMAFITYPLYIGRRHRLSQENPRVGRRDYLLAEKQAVYAAIKDLDFEYKTGKLSDEDYAALRESYRARALHLLKQISELEEDAARSGDADPRAASTRGNSQRQRNASFLTESANRAGVDPLVCARCGEANAHGSKFCRACGTPLETELIRG